MTAMTPLGKCLVTLALLFALCVPLKLLLLLGPTHSRSLHRLFTSLEDTMASGLMRLQTPELYILNAVSDAYFIKALALAVELNIPDLLHTLGPTSNLALATQIKADSGKLSHLMRFLEGKGVFTRVDEEIYGNNEYSELFLETGSLRKVMLLLAEDSYPGLNFLSIFPDSAPLSTELDYLNQIKKPGANSFKSLYRELISEVSLTCAQGVDLPWHQFESKHALSVGGGTTHFLLEALQKQPKLFGTVFDTTENCVRFLELRSKFEGDLKRRLVCEGQRALDEVPEGFDMYILDHVLMRQSDAASLRMLESVVSAMRRTQKMDPVARPVLVIADGGASDFPTLLQAVDLHLSALVHGKIRTATEMQALLVTAGLVVERRQDVNGVSVVLLAGLGDL